MVRLNCIVELELAAELETRHESERYAHGVDVEATLPARHRPPSGVEPHDARFLDAALTAAAHDRGSGHDRHPVSCEPTQVPERLGHFARMARRAYQ
jgi:hypothetical protein